MSDEPVIKIMQLAPGSVVWMHNVRLDAEDPGEALGNVHDQLIAAAGHEQFILVSTEGDGIIDVLGPDEAVERIRAALEPPTVDTDATRWCGVAHPQSPTVTCTRELGHSDKHFSGGSGTW